MVPTCLGVLILLVLSFNHCLFWDTVQFGSTHPDNFFQNNFSSFWLPQKLDSGHPPFFGMYIAYWWTIFGKSLFTTHLAMWPIVFGLLWQIWRLGKNMFPSHAGFVFLLLLVEPVLLGQLTLVSPDLVLIFAFLLAFNEISFGTKRNLIFAIILLAMISTRGMLLGVALYLWFVIKDGDYKGWWKKIGYFIPGGILGLIFLVAHYKAFGWIGYHEGSSWAPSFERVGFLGLLRNTALIGIHLLDFGHCFIFGIIGWTYFRSIPVFTKDHQFKSLVLLFVLIALVLLPTLILHKHLFGHRYLLPLFVVLDITAVYLIVKCWQAKKQGLWFAIGLLILGSFWIYPQPISTSWDSTIMHWGYYQSRNDLIEYINEQNISYDQIGTAFPNINSPAVIDLEGSKISFVKKDLNNQQWIFYSNVMNDFSENELKLLSNEFRITKEFKRGMVRCQLLKKR